MSQIVLRLFDAVPSCFSSALISVNPSSLNYRLSGPLQRSTSFLCSMKPRWLKDLRQLCESDTIEETILITRLKNMLMEEA